MSVAKDDRRGWTRRQWGVVVVCIALMQVGLILVLGERELIPRDAATALGGPFRLVQWPGELEMAISELGVTDPMLFAVPNPRSFSGEAWTLAQDHPAPSLGWGEGNRWLSGESNWFGRWSNVVQAGVLGPRPMRARPVPMETAVEVQPLRVARHSRMELDAGLQARGIESSPELPTILHTNLLDATQVQISVEPDGRIFSAVVLRSCGWEGADQQALELTWQLRFTPTSSRLEPSAERQWGRVRFRWYTARPPVDAPAAAVAPAT